MERTFESAAALVGRAAGPLASSSKACDNMDYVPAAYPLALITNRIVARRDIVRHGT
jgi:hypothetical protein